MQGRDGHRQLLVWLAGRVLEHHRRRRSQKRDRVHNLGIKGRIHTFCACEPPLPSQLPLPSILAAVPAVFCKPNSEQSHFRAADVRIQSSNTGFRMAATRLLAHTNHENQKTELTFTFTLVGAITFFFALFGGRQEKRGSVNAPREGAS